MAISLMAIRLLLLLNHPTNKKRPAVLGTGRFGEKLCFLSGAGARYPEGYLGGFVSVTPQPAPAPLCNLLIGSLCSDIII